MTTTVSFVKQLGKGLQGEVLLCQDEDGKHIAIKLFHRSKYLRSELEVYNRLQSAHNIVQQASIELPAIYHGRAIPMKFYRHGELFDFVLAGHQNRIINEALAKTLFKQCLLGLQQMHSNGIVHRDLKPDNIFVDSNFDLAIGDFGLSVVDEEYKSNQCLDDACGTRAYMAPEVIRCEHEGITYNGYKADMWGAGCLLFLLLTGNLPFGLNGPTNKDYYYYQIRNTNWQEFWNQHEPSSPVRVSADAKRMVQQLLCDNPSARPSPGDVLEDPWFKDEHILSDVNYTQLMERISGHISSNNSSSSSSSSSY